MNNLNPLFVLTEDDAFVGAMSGAGIGAGIGTLNMAFSEWMLKYVKECRMAIMESNTPEEAYRKVTNIAKTDSIISRRYMVGNFIEQKIRNLSLSKNDPDWKDKMYKVVNGTIRSSRFTNILFSAFLTLYGGLAGAAIMA